MANLRIVYDNLTDTTSGLTASSTAPGSVVASNLKTDIKSEVWRSVGTSETLTLTWAATQSINVVCFPFSSFSNTATIDVKFYTLAADTVAAATTGAVQCCNTAFNTSPKGVNSYAYGGSTYAVVYFSSRNVQKIEIVISDASNPLGYIEAGRLVVGSYWSPENNAEYGVDVVSTETTKHERNDAGDLRTDKGVMFKEMNVDLSLMPAADRNTLWKIVRGNGMNKPIFLSLNPDATDKSDEQMYMIYGKLKKGSAFKYQFLNQFNSQLDLEEV